jgi:O-antigen ligase
LLKVFNPSQKVVSKLGIALAGVTLCALAFAFYVSSAKNGFLSLAFALVLFTLFVIKRSRLDWQIGRMAWVMALLCVVVSVYFAKAHIEANPAWKTLVADVQTSVRIDEHQNWKNRAEHPLPLNSAGTTVNGSTYERTAWATAGLILIGEHPLGYGLLNHSFGALAKAKWPDFYPPNGKNRGATHSGWIDLTLGIGIPGLLLLCIPLLVSAWRAWHGDRFWHQYVTLTTPIVFFMYLLSEVSTGHFIEFLLFYTALSCGLVWHLPKQNASDVAH